MTSTQHLQRVAEASRAAQAKTKRENAAAPPIDPESWSDESNARAVQEDFERRERRAQSSVDDY